MISVVDEAEELMNESVGEWLEDRHDIDDRQLDVAFDFPPSHVPTIVERIECCSGSVEQEFFASVHVECCYISLVD